MKHTDLPETTSDINARSDDLLGYARRTEQEEDSLIEFSTLQTQYTSALDTYLEEKFHQVERIEDRLENLIEEQEALLQQYQSNQGEIRTYLQPGKRAALQQNIAARQACIQRLHNRLELVREIKEEITPHGPKIEDLAARKLRFHEPELATGWDAARAAERHRQAQLRKEKSQATHLLHTLSRTRSIERGGTQDN